MSILSIFVKTEHIAALYDNVYKMLYMRTINDILLYLEERHVSLPITHIHDIDDESQFIVLYNEFEALQPLICEHIDTYCYILQKINSLKYYMEPADEIDLIYQIFPPFTTIDKINIELIRINTLCVRYNCKIPDDVLVYFPILGFSDPLTQLALQVSDSYYTNENVLDMYTRLCMHTASITTNTTNTTKFIADNLENLYMICLQHVNKLCMYYINT